MSVVGLLRVELEAKIKHISSHLTRKWKEPYLWTCGYTKIRVAITLVRDTHCCIWGSRILAHKISVQ